MYTGIIGRQATKRIVDSPNRKALHVIGPKPFTITALCPKNPIPKKKALPKICISAIKTLLNLPISFSFIIITFSNVVISFTFLLWTGMPLCK
jgi:hypothetical protein